jgi:hypothetical protein
MPHYAKSSCPAKAGHPVRRGFSILAAASLGYWIARSKPGDDSMGCNRFDFRSVEVTTSRSRGAMRPNFAGFIRPRKQGRRECRTLGASAAACAVVVSTRVSHHGHAGNVRHSPRDGVTAYAALPGDRACLPPSPANIMLANLTPASGRQDHTSLPSALAPFVSGTSASIASRTNVRDDRDTPLLWARDGLDMDVIWVRREPEYFCKGDWTGKR